MLYGIKVSNRRPGCENILVHVHLTFRIVVLIIAVFTTGVETYLVEGRKNAFTK